MTVQYELPIVGAFHHPPAMALVRILPLNAILWVRAESDNRVDLNAIAVDLDIDLLNLGSKVDLKREIKAAFDHFRERHPDTGLWFEDVEKEGTFHLGYIPAVEALPIKTAYPDFGRSRGTLRFGPKAKPFVRFAIEGL
jgi:hypothetical protein